jgi:hypothetical protein
VANITSSVANDETGFKDLTFKRLSECSTAKQIANRGYMNEIQGIEGDRRGDSYRVRTLRDSNCLYCVMRRQQYGESAL